MVEREECCPFISGWTWLASPSANNTNNVMNVNYNGNVNNNNYSNTNNGFRPLASKKLWLFLLR